MRLRAVLLVLLGALTSCVGGGGGGPVSSVALQPSASLDELLNNYRAQRGLSTLRPDPRLKAAAAAHARDIAAHNLLSHRGSDGSNHIRRAERAGYGPYVAENVAAGQKTPAEVMRGWLSSRGHRATIELSPASDFGFAHAVAPETQYKDFWVLVVGRPQPEVAKRRAPKPAPAKAAVAPNASGMTLQIGGTVVSGPPSP